MAANRCRHRKENDDREIVRGAAHLCFDLLLSLSSDSTRAIIDGMEFRSNKYLAFVKLMRESYMNGQDDVEDRHCWSFDSRRVVFIVRVYGNRVLGDKISLIVTSRLRR